MVGKLPPMQINFGPFPGSLNATFRPIPAKGISVRQSDLLAPARATDVMVKRL